MWFLISFFILVWFIAIITFGFTAYWVHAVLLAAVFLGLWNMFRRLRGKV
jgi:hypothetical protein